MSTAMTHAANLSTPYHAKAVYLEDADCVEYTRCDAPSVYRRVDEFLTLILDMNRRELIGLRLKGFRNFYNNNYEKLNKGIKPEFITLVSALEKIIEQIATDVINDADRRAAYTSARNLAHAENVELRDLPQQAA